uniref:UMOD/GP2/OIT3-like D8C domain-containing protein n=1 Tax=Poecilia reticulata TaxID=8081 RepID=A0A3P9PHF8_POERE
MATLVIILLNRKYLITPGFVFLFPSLFMCLFRYYSVLHCDRNIVWSGWYRFYLGQSSARMPEKCVAEYRCGTHATLWINGAHPVQLNEIVTRNVFGSWSGSCLYFASNTIQIKLCSGFYVYKVQLPSSCNLAYCTGTFLW